MAEKGRRDGRTITLDRRLYMRFAAFGDCDDAGLRAIELPDDFSGAVYADAHDPTGIGVLAMAEAPAYFVTGLRQLLSSPPFSLMTRKPEFDMLGRSYSIGYEPDLMETLLHRPRRRVLDPGNAWAVWYPLQRSKAFYRLSADRQRQILAEHGGIGRRYGESGLAADVRLACHGIDRSDNDFVIGLLGRDLHPLSALVQEMRSTEQTSQYLSRLGPFFVGRVLRQSGA